ncbi:unnamed protein product [Ostreobium quekettii]|uniref:GATA-type domain-containing protein n=1 Tax=Ostreobium quekettii TaxID=121088 RepID=A0A8S1IP24_9CHLO|nr:unnamed protein product [Ostreobium quekettii]|eukprot:evm.model.scf_1253.2 EVM.evm.TU.scf_1253.2   scf_1253:13381-15960(+)
MDGSSGVAIAVPCLVLSPAGPSLPANGKGAAGAGATVPSADGLLGPASPLVKSSVGEVAMINTHESASSVGGSPVRVPGLDGADGIRIALVRTETGEAVPVVIGGAPGAENDPDLAASVIRLCSTASEAGGKPGVQGAKGAVPAGWSDESERLAQYNETVTLLMQTEPGDKDSTTSEATNQDSNSNSSGGDTGSEAPAVDLGSKWPEAAARAPALAHGGWHGARRFLGTRGPWLGSRMAIGQGQQGNGDGKMGERRPGRADVRGPDCEDGGVGAMLRAVEAGLRTMRPTAAALAGMGDGRSDAERDLKAHGEGVGVACYVACQQLESKQQQEQRKQAREQQQQQQQLALCWHAYLSGLYNGYGLASGPASGPPAPRSPPPFSTLQHRPLPSGWVLNTSTPANIKEVQEAEDDDHVAGFDYCGQKRFRAEEEMHCIKLRLTKKGRKRVEDRVCSNCCTRTTPFWRKDRHSGKPLCNACGLYFSKNDVPRPVSLWRNAGGSGDP